MSEFYLGDGELFWDGTVALECPFCRTLNHVTSDHSATGCTRCNHYVRWRRLAFRIHRMPEAPPPPEVSADVDRRAIEEIWSWNPELLKQERGAHGARRGRRNS